MKRIQKKHRIWLVLAGILLLALFFRIFKLDVFYIYEHDQDLYSWIVKDIWIDHHLRLIGQVTSIEGVFIGPLYYYLLVPFFAISGMNPISAAWFAAFTGLITVFSVYYIFQRFFGKAVGLFGAAIYATSIGTVFFDRWAVPTEPTLLWCFWLLYTVFSLAEGKTKSLIVAAILVGLIWHIHIALLPLTPLLIFSFFLARQKLTPKLVGLSMAILLVLTTPFWIFEYKHQFLQTKSLLFTSGGAGIVLKGWARFLKIIDATQIILKASLFDTWDVAPRWLVPVLSGVLFIFTIFKKLLTKKQIIVLVAWVVLVLGFQMATKNPISEYYMANLTVIPILLVALFLGYMWHHKNWKILAVLVILAYMGTNFYLLITKPEDWNHYKYKEETVEFIKQDATKNHYQCISEDYINSFLGTAVGFRYMTWWKGLHLVQKESGAPKYTIVIPYDATDSANLTAHFHYFGVIVPKAQNYDFSKCNDPKFEPIPLLGFTH